MIKQTADGSSNLSDPTINFKGEFMNKSILITGVAGSGKSAVCDELEKLGYKAFGIEDMKDMFTMIDRTTGKKSEIFDNDNIEMVKKHDWICDKEKLRKLIEDNKDGIVFYAGTGSNMDDILPLFDMVFLLKPSPETLTKRLSKRTSEKFGRTQEVQEWVFSWKDWWEEKMEKDGAVVVDANQDLEKVVADIIKKVES